MNGMIKAKGCGGDSLFNFETLMRRSRRKKPDEYCWRAKTNKCQPSISMYIIMHIIQYRQMSVNPIANTFYPAFNSIQHQQNQCHHVRIHGVCSSEVARLQCLAERRQEYPNRIFHAYSTKWQHNTSFTTINVLLRRILTFHFSTMHVIHILLKLPTLCQTSPFRHV